MMDRIELQMDKTVFVMGAGITASLKHEKDRVMQECVAKLRLENSNAVLVETQLEQILASFDQPSSDGLSLADFQRKGALLAYLYADKTIDQALDQSSLTATNVDKWVEQSTTGIMHLFGVCNDIDSMQYLENDTTIVPDSLLHVFKHKVCVCIGFDQEGQTDLQTFLNQLPLREMPNVLLPCSSMSKIESTVGLPISVDNVLDKLSPLENSTKTIGERLDHDDHSFVGQPLSLLMAADKTVNYVKTAMLLSTLPGMKFQLMNNIECNGSSFHLLTVQVECKKFREFWCALMQPNIMESLISQTVMAVILNQFTFIWLRTDDGLPMTTDVLPTVLPKSVNGHNGSRYSLLVHAAKQIKMVRSKYSAIPKLKQSVNNGRKGPLQSRNNSHSGHVTNYSRAANTTSKGTTKIPLSAGTLAARKSQPLHSIHINTRLVNKAVKPYETLRILLQKPTITTKVKKICFNDKQILTAKQKQFAKECREWSLHMDEVWENKKKAEKKAKAADKIRHTVNESNRVINPPPLLTSTSYSSKQKSVATATTASLPRFSFNRSQLPSITAGNIASITAPMSSPLSAIPPQSSKSIFSTAVTPMINPFVMPTAPSRSSIHPSGIVPPALPIPPAVTPVLPRPSLPTIATIPIPPTIAPSIHPTIPIPPTIPPVTPAISTPAFVPPCSSINPCISPCIPCSPLQTAATPMIYPASAYLSATSYPFLSSSVNFPYLFRNPSSLMLTPPTATTLPLTQDQVAVKRAFINHDSNSEDDQRQQQSRVMMMSQATATQQSLSPSSDKDESSPSTSAMSCDSPDEIDIEEDTVPLWKFIIELLLLNSHSHVISWRQVHSLEFQIKQPLELVRVWGSYKHEESHKSTECNYKKFRGALHYYSIKDQPILRCISVKDEIYRFSDSMLRYINNRYLMLKKNEASVFNFSSLERNARCPA